MKIRHQSILSKKVIVAAGTMSALVGASQGAVIEFWDFEDGTAGSAFTPAGTGNGSGGSTGVNGTLMRGWDATYGGYFTSTTLPNGGNISAEFNNQDGYVTEGALHNWSSPNWTLELSVNFDDLGGWETMVGRDGSTVGSPESDFYFQVAGNTGDADSGQFRLNYVDNDGARHVLVSNTTLQEGVDYGLAAVIDSDAGSISLYVDSGSGYALDAQATDLSGDLGIANTGLNWTFSRGWYNGGFGDHTDASYDNIRFSDTALSAGDMIGISEVQVSAVPEPSGVLALGLLFGASMLTRRR